jgi:hypothetical protein
MSINFSPYLLRDGKDRLTAFYFASFFKFFFEKKLNHVKPILQGIFSQ